MDLSDESWIGTSLPIQQRLNFRQDVLLCFRWNDAAIEGERTRVGHGVVIEATLDRANREGRIAQQMVPAPVELSAQFAERGYELSCMVNGIDPSFRCAGVRGRPA